jgi:hypothetical protein
MTMAHDLIIDQYSPMAEGDKPLATWYAQGHSDGLGDRLLMFDNTSAPSWEILRFRPALGRDPKFEAALRERVERLTSFHHPAFPVVRPIKELGQGDGLAVVSTYAPGMRLSEALKKPRGAAFAVRMLRQLVPALAALQQHGPGIAHGLLDVDRIVVTAQGRLTIREHMVGSALGSLELSAARLWGEFGILASPIRTTTPTLDGRSDIIQMGLVVLSLMAGRRIGPDEYPDKVEQLLDEIADRSARHARVIFQPLRYWLERALQLDDYNFESAEDANEALPELRDDSERGDDYLASLGPHTRETAEAVNLLDDGSEWRQGRRGPHLIGPKREEIQEPQMSTPVIAGDVPVAQNDRARKSGKPGPRVMWTADWFRWAAMAVAVVSIGEAVLIVRLLYKRPTPAPPTVAAVLIDSPQPGANVLVDDLPVGVTPLELKVGDRVKSIRVLPANPVIQQVTEPESTIEADKRSATKPDSRLAGVQGTSGSQRTGAFRLSSPIEVHVLDGERVLGSSAEGPIVATAGRHEFEFVNTTIGYRERKFIDVKPGQITSMSVSLPNGTLNINAVPWASVWIDGNSVGETPLGNLSIALGEHEIVFRHPQLGERRERTVVRADGATRVSVNLQR